MHKIQQKCEKMFKCDESPKFINFFVKLGSQIVEVVFLRSSMIVYDEGPECVPLDLCIDSIDALKATTLQLCQVLPEFIDIVDDSNIPDVENEKIPFDLQCDIYIFHTNVPYDDFITETRKCERRRLIDGANYMVYHPSFAH
jgi:hypothetical protein